MPAIRVFHSTDAAELILADGFMDTVDLFHLRGEELRGVWVSDVPVDANEGAKGDQLLVVEVEESDLAPYEADYGNTYRQWCVPASLLNGRSVRQLSDEESDAAWEEGWRVREQRAADVADDF